MMQRMPSLLARRFLRNTPAGSYTRKFTSDTSDGQLMERCINRVELLGRVGNDPQKRGTEEHPVVIFSLATNYLKSKEGENVEQQTDWHRVSVFKPRLKDTVYNYLKKGNRVLVTGSLRYGEVPSSDGNGKVMITSIVADDVIFFASK